MTAKSIPALLLLLCLQLQAVEPPANPFRSLDEKWPTPNTLRRASGAPGHDYWQQRADYDIAVTLNEKKLELTGRATINYHNNSPDNLSYLWVQLDQNLFADDSGHQLISQSPDLKKQTYESFDKILTRQKYDGRLHIKSVTSPSGQPLNHTIVETMMRIDLKKPLAPNKQFSFTIDWSYRIQNAKKIRSRSGYEYFEKDKNHVFTMAQFYPRMAAYTDVHGWQNHPFTGSEFTLEFGDYKMSITVPSDHIVSATGLLQNPEEVLTETQQKRLKKSRTADTTLLIVTREEAEENEKKKARDTKTWIFHSKNVRDVAFATSRKFLWDALPVKLGNKTVMAMSFWPKEGDPLWGQYSTRSVEHTLKVYSKFTFDYPYPVAQSVNSPIYGMEYPMICFQAPRPEEDGTYTEKTKHALISVIIHEVGHNWFPMIVNSDERRWLWMDEGLNSFMQFIAEMEWEDDYPARITSDDRIKSLKDYLKNPNKRPIMTDADTVIHFGANGYSKPTLGLNILRETILGRELFDFAFKEYSRRWMFKRPTPYDFFRTMEDASGKDLDWFWRGWFYSIDHVDISIEDVTHFTLDTRDPAKEKGIKKSKRDEEPDHITVERNKDMEKAVDEFPELVDFYTDFDPLDVTPKNKEDYEKLLKKLKPHEKRLLKTKGHFHVIRFNNIGGMPMPLLLEMTFDDNRKETIRIPAEIWRTNNDTVTKLIYSKRKIRSVSLDPKNETYDIDRRNNHFPRRIEEKTFQLQEKKTPKNPIQLKNEADKKATEKKKASDK